MFICWHKKNADIKELFDKSGLKHWELAEKVGISPNTYECCTNQPMPEHYRELFIKALKEKGDTNA